MAKVVYDKDLQYGGGNSEKTNTDKNTTTYADLQLGSSGDDVKKLQQTLINKGYSVGNSGADGIFGNDTLSAVKQYQKDNGLDVDGIAGNKTLSLLYSGNTSNNENSSAVNGKPVVNTGGATNNSGNSTDVNSTYSTKGYSQEVIDAFNLLDQYAAQRPAGYTPVWQDEADAYLTQYQNRDPFSYDFNSDALYNQYKDQYIQQGRMAMMDTMGQAAAMTGGYGSTYAQTVGQQAYNQQLGQLNDIMPELYGMAYDRYNQEGQDLLNMYDIYMGKEQNERQIYQDSVDNWYKEHSMLQDDANTKYNRWWNENVATLGEGESPDYTALTYDEYQKWTKSFEKENTVKGVKHLGDMLEGAGYNPEFVAMWVDFYLEKLTGGGGGNDAPPAGVVSGGGGRKLNTESNRLTL